MPKGKWYLQDNRAYKFVPFDDKVGSQIEAAFRRGESSVNIHMSDQQCHIDFRRRRLTCPYGSDRMIKREEVESANPYEVDEYANPRMNVDGILSAFDTYQKASTSSAEDSRVEGEGLMKLTVDLGGDAESDPFPLLLFACKIQASVPWVLQKEEWVTGLRSLGLDKWAKVKDAVNGWKSELRDPTYFKYFYHYVFDWTRENLEVRYIPAEDSCLSWNQILRPRTGKFPWDAWNEFVEKVFGKGISRDVWRQLLDLSLQVQQGTLRADFKDYDEDMGAWPTLVDDFVEWGRKTGKLAAAQ